MTVIQKNKTFQPDRLQRMGISTTHIISHDLYFEHTDEWITQVQQRTGMPVFTEMYYTDGSQPNVLAPDNFDGWVMWSRDDLPLQQMFESGEMITMQAKSTWLNGLTAYINPYTMNVCHEEFYMGRWSSVKYLADWLYANGLPNYQHYQHKTDGVFWILNNRMNLFEFCRMFQQGDLKLVSFCDDLHQQWITHFFEDKWRIEDFINWGRKELSLVTFGALTNFVYPEAAPDCYNVMIEDNFTDLFVPEYQWVQPTFKVYFRVDVNNTIHADDTERLLTALATAAMQLNMEVSTTTGGGIITGEIQWLRKFFPEYLAHHFITNFFKGRGLDVTVNNPLLSPV